MKYSLDDGAYDIKRAHPTDAGVDICSPIDVIVPANGSVVINTGVHVQLDNSVGLLMPKSGLNVKHDILSFGVIDEGYSGQIAVKLYNHGTEDYHVHAGDKISQLLEIPVYYRSIQKVDQVFTGERGNNGFGSTGR